MASENITKILDEIKALSVTELFDLEKAIEEEFGVSAAAVAVAAPAGGAADGAAAAEKTEFTVFMKSFGASAPAGVLFEKFGFTVDHVAEVVRKVVADNK